MKMMQTALAGVIMLEPKVFTDNRGFFVESYNQQTLRQVGLETEFVQDNHSLSVSSGTVRGLHFQLPPQAQTKLVRVVAGAIYDVAVDIRKGSATFGKWVGVTLTATNHRQLLIPKGFAHGFCTLVPNTEVMYKVDAYYSPEHDAGILWSDPWIAIDWPYANVTLSDKDTQHPLLQDAKVFD